MPAQLAPPPIFQAFAKNGQFLVGGQLFTYAAGTTTPQATYTDETMGTANTNPIVLNSYGMCSLWFDQSLAYKLVLTDAAANVYWTVDQINSYINAAGLASALSTYATIASLSNYVTMADLVTALAPYALTSSLSAYAPIASPTFTGIPAGPTATVGTSTTQLATTAFVTAAAAGLTLTRSGTFSCINGTVAVTFASAFPTTCNAVVWSANYASPDVGWITPGSVTAAGFSFTNGNAGSCYYIATGS